MTNFISAGVYAVEQDLSAYISNLSSTIVGMVGTADSGPTNTPILITTQNDFVNTFGNVNPQHYLGYAAMSYLEQGNMLWVTRVTASDAKFAAASMFLPSNYTQYQGAWSLASQTASTVTLTLTDLPTVTTVAKTIVLDAETVLPGFDPTDTTNAAVSVGKLGSDFLSLASVSSNSPALGAPFTILTGPGKGTVASITGVSTVGTTPTLPQVTLPLSAFSTTNSPVAAMASGSIALQQPSAWTPPTNNTAIMTLGVTSTGLPINLVYDSTSGATILSKINAGTFGLTDLESLLAVVGGGSPTSYSILLPIYDPTIAGNNANTLSILNAILSEALSLVNQVSAPASGSPNSLAFYNACRVLLPGSTLYGIGSLDVNGNSKGFSAVDTNLDYNGNIIQIRLSALVAGIKGTFLYSAQSVTPNATLTTSDQVLTGTFNVGLYRPTWNTVKAGTSYVPTVLKFTSLGEADLSNTSIVLSMNITDQTASDVQNYTLSFYQRNSSISVLSTSQRLVDFNLIEQYQGTIESIQSQLTASSRIAVMKIDYTTVDALNMITGAVTLATSNSDYLNFSPVFLLSETNSGISAGTKYVSSPTGFNKTLFNTMFGGSLGSSVSSYDIVGNGVNTGLYSFANAEAIDINLLLAPGWSADPIVSTAMITICQGRGDAMSIIDPPFGLNVQSAVAYRNNIANINSSYGAMYYPWIQIADSVNKKNVFVPPSGQVVAQYAYNDSVADVYYAPAGVNRGMLTDALATERLLSQGDRDALSLAHINPIHNEPGYGIYIRGQYTLQTTTTALDRVNVRRLLLSLRKVIATASKVFEFEPGDMTTAYRLQQVADGLLKAQQKLGAIQSYTIDVGPNVNTAAVLNNNQLAMKISIVPTKTAEIIIETFTILPQVGVTSTTSTSTV